MTTRFDRDTAVTALGDGVFGASMDPGWWVVSPNGGYVAAVVLRALAAAVDDPQRAARSFTLHYLSRPMEGPVQVETRVERRGRSLTSTSARLVQDGRVLGLALAAFSRPRSRELDFTEEEPPSAPPPERCATLPRRIPVHHRFEHRWAVGKPPFEGGHEARGGGWIRLAPDEGTRAVDAVLAAAYSDAWPPALFSRLAAHGLGGGVPTVDLTVHFRASLPLEGARDDEFTLALFRSRLAREGFIEEDGELWSRDGRLIALSRQHAIVA